MYRVVASILLVIIATAVSIPTLTCVHGVRNGTICVCKEDYFGKRCERKRHCYSFMRYDNGSCVECEKYWNGTQMNCDSIICDKEFGKATKDKLMCECTEPATGVHCEILHTDDVLLHYNRKMEKWGPIGALSLIPMIACFLLCNRMADRRQVRRIERALGDQDNVNGKALEELLEVK